MSYTKHIDNKSFKKTRTIYLFYFLIAILLLIGVCSVPYCLSLVEEINSYAPLIVLGFVPVLLYYAYQGYTMLIYGEMYVSNGVIYYRGYDKGWFPKKIHAEIPLSEIHSISTITEEITRNFPIELLCIKTADSSIFLNVSSFAKTSMLKTLTAQMLECNPSPTPVHENITLNLHKPAIFFYPRYLRVFINGNKRTFNKDSKVYSFQVRTGDIVSIKYSNMFRIFRIIQSDTIDLMLDLKIDRISR